MGEITLKHGNALEMGGFKHFRVGHELARPTNVLNGGQEILATPSGRTFTAKKIG